MEFDPKTLSGRDAYQLMSDCLVPRPIAWISTCSPEGLTNLAPFSFFNGVNAQPPIISVAIGKKRSGDKKDTLFNIEATKEFVVNIVNESCLKDMVQSSFTYPADESEIEALNLQTLPSKLVKPPRIANSPVHMECKWLQTVELEGINTSLVLAEVIYYHIDDKILTDGRVLPNDLKSVARYGGLSYGISPKIIDQDIE